MKRTRYSQISLVVLLLVSVVLVMFLAKWGISIIQEDTLVPASTRIPSVEAGSFQYGIHYPNGIAAVDYLYRPEGMWKELNLVEYRWNYYEKCANSDHPFGKNDLIATATGTRFFTAGDANCHLLLDWNQDGELDANSGGYAFHEHSGLGINGQVTGAPFTVFWFDDNQLASYMSEAYGRPKPSGLSDTVDFTRWQVLSGDVTHWTPYAESDYIDQLALNGMYYLATNKVNAALQQWDRILKLSGYRYTSENQRCVYPNISESYHLGLFEILTGFLMDHPSVSTGTQQELVSQWVFLRSNILSSQESINSSFYGWRSNINDPNSLVNTESIAANVLGLGAGALQVFEAGQAPLQMSNNNYFVRPHQVLSAVKDVSAPGYLTFGPDLNYFPGSYAVDFFLRAPAPLGKMATIDVFDSQTNQVLASQDVLAASMSLGNEWTRITLSFSITNPNSNLGFRTYWHGTANMDIAAIRVRQP